MNLFDLFEDDEKEQGPVTEEDAHRFGVEVKARCSDIVNFYRAHNMFFYRGTTNAAKAKGIIWNTSTRVDRKTMNTTPELQGAVDILMRGQGLTAVRSNSIFMTAQPKIAQGYGVGMHIIFPVNGFHYSWSPNVKDFYVYGFRQTIKDMNPKFIKSGVLAPTADELLNKAIEQDYDWFKRTYQYRNTHLADAARAQVEVLMAGQYLGFPVGHSIGSTEFVEGHTLLYKLLGIRK